MLAPWERSLNGLAWRRTAQRILLVASAAWISGCTAAVPSAGEPVTRPGIALGRPTAPPVFWVEAPIAGDPSPLLARIPPSGAVVEGSTARLLRPPIASTPRRVAIQVGHWKVEEAPAEFPNLRWQFGASFDGVDEVNVNLDMAHRVAQLLVQRGMVVDVLPATVPPGYLADVFVALHADGDGFREARGFKIAHGFYRGPHEEQLVRFLTDEYAEATGLPWDERVSGDFTEYYAFAWYRYEHALAPHTAAAIIEMGYLSSRQDRAVLLDKPDVVARAIADGTSRFLAAVPRSALFGQDIIVPVVPPP